MNADEIADDAELVSRWLGRTINNKYVVQSVVGSGGMAVVYAVKHRNGKRFALKMLHRELSLNSFIRQRFVREGYVANRVEHEGAVAVIDDDIADDGSAFLVMDLLHGVTLERLWEANGNHLTLECVLAIAEQLLDVLAAAHAQGIVHRDLKPANVFITRNGVVKILDFGIARLREGDGSKTESGTTLGTPLFMPPEQASGRSRDVDGRTDLWAVGATMFSSLSGQYVHDGENAAQVLIAVATTPSRSLAAVLPDAPPEVVAIVDKALAFHNEDRWESAATMRAAVLAAQASLRLVVSNEFLARIVRVTAPGTSNGDVQSTPSTTPAPSRTERMPSTPSRGLGGEPSNSAGSSGPSPAVGMNATKRSELAPGGASGELADTSARALTSPTVMPPFRSPSRVLASVIVVASLAAIGGAIFAIRFATGSDRVPPPMISPTTSAPAVTTSAAAPSVPTPSAAGPSLGEAPRVDISAGPLPSATAVRVPAIGPRPIRRPPPRSGTKPTTSESTETVETAPTSAPTSPATTPPATTAPPSSTQVNGHKPPAVLDRTSPFGNN